MLIVDKTDSVNNLIKTNQRSINLKKGILR